MTNKERFYCVFDVLFRDGNWKGWGLSAIVSGALMASMPLFFYDASETRKENMRTGDEVDVTRNISNVNHNRVNQVYMPINSAY